MSFSVVGTPAPTPTNKRYLIELKLCIISAATAIAEVVPCDGDDQGWTTSVRSRSGPVQSVGPTFFEMESDRTDRRLDLDRTDFRPIQKELGLTDRCGPCLTIGPNRSVGPI